MSGRQNTIAGPMPTESFYSQLGRVCNGVSKAFACGALLLLTCLQVRAESCVQADAVPDVPAANLYLIIGQSNAVGLASVHDLVPPAPEYVSAATEYPNVQIYGIYGAPAGVAGNDDPVHSRAVAWSTFAQWHNVKPGFGFKNLSGNEQHFPAEVRANDLFGPEIYLAHHLSGDGPRVHYLLKLAVARTALAPVDGEDGWAPGGHLYSELLKMVAAAVKEKSAESRIRVAGVFFVQGESDASNSALASSYQKNIIKFIQRIRSDLYKMECSNLKNIPFVLARVQENSGWSQRDMVRKAQEKASRVLIRVKLIDTDDLIPHMTAGANHFNEYGQSKLGERFYRALNLQSSWRIGSGRMMAPR